jgi:hypothetical protein
MAQPPQNVGLGDSDAGLDFCLVPRPPRRQDSDRIMRRHRAAGAVDLRVVEEASLTPLFRLSEISSSGAPPKKRNMRTLGAGPVRERLRPGRLGIGEVRGAEHADEDLRLADLSRRRIGDPDPRAPIVDEGLLPATTQACRFRFSLTQRESASETPLAVAPAGAARPRGAPTLRARCARRLGATSSRTSPGMRQCQAMAVQFSATCYPAVRTHWADLIRCQIRALAGSLGATVANMPKTPALATPAIATTARMRLKPRETKRAIGSLTSRAVCCHGPARRRNGTPASFVE